MFLSVSSGTAFSNEADWSEAMGSVFSINSTNALYSCRSLQHHTTCIGYRMDNSRQWSTQWGYFTGENVCWAYENNVEVTVNTYLSTLVCVSILTPEMMSHENYRYQPELVAIKYQPSKKAGGCFVVVVKKRTQVQTPIFLCKL